MKNSKIKKGQNFKSISQVLVNTERGEYAAQIEDKVLNVKNDRVYLQGLYCDFNISVLDFETRNIHTK